MDRITIFKKFICVTLAVLFVALFSLSALSAESKKSRNSAKGKVTATSKKNNRPTKSVMEVEQSGGEGKNDEAAAGSFGNGVVATAGTIVTVDSNSSNLENPVVVRAKKEAMGILPLPVGESESEDEESVSGVSGDVDTRHISKANRDKNYEIYVNIPAFSLYLIADGEIEQKFRVRVGAPKTKTRTGSGSITRKFSPSYFRFSSGDKKGQIIQYSNLRNKYKGKIVDRIKIPYHKIKGLELEIDGEISGQIIHSTTNPETMGHACSSGCVGMEIDDMLELYDCVDVGTKVLIEYNPVEFHDEIFYFYDDVYDLKPDYEELVREHLKTSGISYTDDFVKTIVKKSKKQKTIKILDIYREMKDKLEADDVR